MSRPKVGEITNGLEALRDFPPPSGVSLITHGVLMAWREAAKAALDEIEQLKNERAHYLSQDADEVARWVEEEKCGPLRKELDDCRATMELFANILRHVAMALGKPSSGLGSSWDSIPLEISKLRASFGEGAP
jgi:hypothetical protein